MFSNFKRPMPPGVGRRSIYDGPSAPWVDPPAPQDVPAVSNFSQQYDAAMNQGGLGGSPMALTVKPSSFAGPQKAPQAPPMPPMRPMGLGQPQEPTAPPQSPYDPFSRGDNPWRLDASGSQALERGPGQPGDGLKGFLGSGAPEQFKGVQGPMPSGQTVEDRSQQSGIYDPYGVRKSLVTNDSPLAKLFQHFNLGAF